MRKLRDLAGAVFGPVVRFFTRPSDYSAFGRGAGVEEPLEVDAMRKHSTKYSKQKQDQS
jgi:hypothetical protein